MPDETSGTQPQERQLTEPAREPLRKLTLGQFGPTGRSPQVGPEPATTVTHDAVDWATLAARCRAKAEAARWAAERQRRIHERSESTNDDAPHDRVLVEWAEALTDAFYWASASETPDIALLDHVGGCFETVAEGMLLVRDAEQRRGGLERDLPLLAEAQAALRQSLQRLGTREDPDQVDAFERVRDTAARHRLFLKRFLRANDPAEPAGWPGLLARIEAQVGGRPQSQRQSILFEQLRTLCSPSEGERTVESWRAIAMVVEELIGEGMAPSSREVRELLLPGLDALPESDVMPPGFQRVLREIDRYLATRHGPATKVAPEQPAASVREAARLVSGRSIVLIGGLRRSEAQRSLKLALGLKELVWIETKEHQSISAFEPAIARPDVALVLLAIRWASHAFGALKPYCDRHGKLLVRLPGGYSPNQVAAQILAQCSEHLGER